jgi:hypothetical protein
VTRISLALVVTALVLQSPPLAHAQLGFNLSPSERGFCLRDRLTREMRLCERGNAVKPPGTERQIVC